MSIRFILLVLLGWILWELIKRRYKRFLQHQRKTTSSPPPAAVPKHGAMVRCDYCDLHLPENEALRSENTYYCCEEHKRLAQQAK